MIIAFCGLSGTGKSTIASEVSKLINLPFIITCTTRPMRPGEKNGVDYYFINNHTWNILEECGRLVATQSFEVANGEVWKYGIDKIDLRKDVVMVLTPEGIKDLRALGYEVVAFYIDIDEDTRLERIYKRKDNQGFAEIKRRSQADMELFKNFVPDYIINNNGSLSETLEYFNSLYNININNNHNF